MGDRVRDFSEELKIRPQAGSEEAIGATLAELMGRLNTRTAHHLGYPYNLRFQWAELASFLKYSVNNLGDPFRESNYGVHVCDFERAVIDFFAELWGLATPGDTERRYWGYVTCCGTEGNLLGILYGREKVPDCVLYCSQEAHYSCPKAAAMYRIPCEQIPTDPSGEMQYAVLEERIRAHPGKGVLLALAVGTTVKGAYDSVDEVLKVLERCGIGRERYYIHCDGALNGLILPFVDQAHAASLAPEALAELQSKCVSFEKPIDSISVSGHKMLGAPMPCGVVVTRIEHMKRWASEVEYVNSTDTTITGSRNGQAALAMWISLQHKGLDGLRREAVESLDNARYFADLLRSAGISCMLNRFSTTVVLERPPERIVRKWQLACTGNIAHVVVMPSVSREKLRRFFDEMMTARSEDGITNIVVKDHIGEENCVASQKELGNVLFFA